MPKTVFSKWLEDNWEKWPYRSCKQTKGGIYCNYVLMATPSGITEKEMKYPPGIIPDNQQIIHGINVDCFKTGINGRVDWDIVSGLIQQGNTRVVPPLFDPIVEFALKGAVTMDHAWSTRILHLMWIYIRVCSLKGCGKKCPHHNTERACYAAGCPSTDACSHGDSRRHTYAIFMSRLARTFVSDYLVNAAVAEAAVYRWSRFCYIPAYDSGCDFEDICRKTHSFLIKEIEGKHAYITNPIDENGEVKEVLFELPPGVTPDEDTEDLIPPGTPAVGYGVTYVRMTPPTVPVTNYFYHVPDEFSDLPEDFLAPRYGSNTRRLAYSRVELFSEEDSKEETIQTKRPKI